jgi:hypothetical protein
MRSSGQATQDRCVSGQEAVFEAVRVHRLTEQIPLEALATMNLQGFQLCSCFNNLGHYLEAKGSSGRQDRFHERTAAGVCTGKKVASVASFARRSVNAIFLNLATSGSVSIAKSGCHAA